MGSVAKNLIVGTCLPRLYFLIIRFLAVLYPSTSNEGRGGGWVEERVSRKERDGESNQPS